MGTVSGWVLLIPVAVALVAGTYALFNQASKHAWEARQARVDQLESDYSKLVTLSQRVVRTQEGIHALGEAMSARSPVPSASVAEAGARLKLLNTRVELAVSREQMEAAAIELQRISAVMEANRTALDANARDVERFDEMLAASRALIEETQGMLDEITIIGYRISPLATKRFNEILQAFQLTRREERSDLSGVNAAIGKFIRETHREVRWLRRPGLMRWPYRVWAWFASRKG